MFDIMIENMSLFVLLTGFIILGIVSIILRFHYNKYYHSKEYMIDIYSLEIMREELIYLKETVGINNIQYKDTENMYRKLYIKTKQASIMAFGVR